VSAEEIAYDVHELIRLTEKACRNLRVSSIHRDDIKQNALVAAWEHSRKKALEECTQKRGSPMAGSDPTNAPHATRREPRSELEFQLPWPVPYSYIHAIVKHERFDTTRHRLRSRELFANLGLLDFFPSKETDSPRKAADVSDEVRHLLRLLTEEERLVLKMHYLDDVSYKDIAQRLNMTPGAVRQRASRARKIAKEHAKARGLRPEDLDSA
jgi:RNA polymerase sigma factor (sigma-70 family)